MTMGPGIFAPQGECTKLKKATATGTLCLSREQRQPGQVCTHYFGNMALTKPPKSKKVWISNGWLLLLKIPTARSHYIFKSSEEEDIALPPHGNARGSCKRPYVRTVPSTFSSIQKECLHKKPKRLYGEKFSSNGGLLDSDSASSEPINP